MTTTVTTASSGPLIANGTAPIPFTFQALSSDEIRVTLNGFEVSPATYIVTLNDDGTGSITPTASWGTGEVYIYSDPDYQQNTIFARHGAWYPDLLNLPLNRLARSIIALKEWVLRQIDVALGNIPAGPMGPPGSLVVSGLEFVTPQQFGAVADGVTNDGPAFVAAIAYLKSIAKNDGVIYKASVRLHVPPGHYYMGTTTLDITHTLIIEGEGSGKAGGVATKLRWAANATGIRIQRYNTSGATTIDGVQHYGGDATILRGLQLIGAFTNMASEGEVHGVFAKARVTCEDVWCQDWQGDGFRIGAPGGNANNVALIRCTAWYCRNGLFMDGADANAGYVEDFDFSFNRAYGIAEESHLGNQYSGGHADSNGIAYTAADNIATMVSHGGNRYHVRFEQATGASTNAPTGTTASNTWWIYQQAGGPAGSVIPAWTSGIAVREGGPYRVAGNPANQSTFVGMYTEGGQPFAKGYGNALTISGSQNVPVAPNGIVHVKARNSAFSIEAGSRLEVQDAPSIFKGPSNDASVATFGRDGGVTSSFDKNIKFFTENTTFGLEFYSNAGGQNLDAWIFSLRGGGLYVGGWPRVNLRASGADIATVEAAGINLASSKVLQVAGTQVVGARQTGTPANATDLATALTLLNDLKAKLVAHGLIS